MKNLKLVSLNDYDGEFILVNKETDTIEAFDSPEEFITELIPKLKNLKGGDKKYSDAYRKLIEDGLKIVDTKEDLAKYIWLRNKSKSYNWRDMKISEEIYIKLRELKYEVTETYTEYDDDGEYTESYEVNMVLDHMLQYYITWCLINNKNCTDDLINELSWRVNNANSVIENSDYLLDLEDAILEIPDEKYISIDVEDLNTPYSHWLFSLMEHELKTNIETELNKSRNINNCPSLIKGVTQLIDKMLNDFSE